MKQLVISPKLSLPLDAATQTFAFIGRKGSGKTYGAGKLVECLLDSHVQVCILDSVGNWYGLRLNADTKYAGYDIPVLGGLRGDIPLEATGGHLIADILTETGRSLIVDISQFSKSDRQRFATAFAERLWRNKKAEPHPSPVHLVIEESQLIVPENVRGDSAQMVGIYEEIIRLGRNYGVGVSMISQRPQSVNKEVLNQTECLFAFQVNGKHERVALRDWIVYHGAEKSLVDELPGLSVGTAYVWSPQWLRILQKVEIGKKKTLDSSATPKVGSTQTKRELKPLDLDDLKARMASTIEKAKADDPRELRKQIAELKKQLAQQPKPVAEVKTVEVYVIEPEHLSALVRLRDEMEGLSDRTTQAIDQLSKSIGRAFYPSEQSKAASAARRQRAAQPAAERPTAQHRAPQPATQNGNIHLKAGERRLLQALAQRYPLKLTRAQLGTLAGFTPSGGTFQNYFGMLKREGFLIVEQSGEVLATEAGLNFLGADVPPAPSTTAELQEMWRATLKAGEAAMLDALLSAYPDALTREVLGDTTGFTYTGGTFQNYLGTLRRNGLVDVEGQLVRASETLFL